MREHVLLGGVRVGPGHPHRVADPAGRLARVDGAALGEDRAERDRQSGLRLPPVAQVGEGVQAVPLEGEPGLVDDQARVVPSGRDRGHDLVERHDDDLRRWAVGRPEPHQQVRRGAVARHRHPPAGERRRGRRVADQYQRTAAAAQRAAGREKVVPAQQPR